MYNVHCTSLASTKAHTYHFEYNISQKLDQIQTTSEINISKTFEIVEKNDWSKNVGGKAMGTRLV